MDALGVVALLQMSEAPRPHNGNDMDWYYQICDDGNRHRLLRLFASAAFIALTNLVRKAAAFGSRVSASSRISSLRRAATLRHIQQG